MRDYKNRYSVFVQNDNFIINKKGEESMVKKVFSFFLTLIFTLILFNNEVLADTNDHTLPIKIGDNLTVEVFNDGRIAPVSNPDELYEHELDLILNEIGYSQFSIKNYALERKRELASIGGKVAEGEIESITHSYVNNQESIEITPDNYNNVREKQKRDLEEYSLTNKQKEQLVLPDKQQISSTCSGGNGICQDGKLSAQIYAVKMGETSSQYQYMVVQDFQWSPPPFVAPKDLAGVHWAPYGQPIEGTAYGEGAYKLAGHTIT